MHTRRESGRDVNRREKASPPPFPRRGPLPTHAQHFSHPRAQPPEGWREPCPPLCSAAGTAARRARARWAARGALRAAGRTHRAHALPRCVCGGGGGGVVAVPPAMGPVCTTRPCAPISPLAFWGLGWALGFFFPRGWIDGWGSPHPTTSSIRGQGLQLCRHLFNELASIFFFFFAFPSHLSRKTIHT